MDYILLYMDLYIYMVHVLLQNRDARLPCPDGKLTNPWGDMACQPWTIPTVGLRSGSSEI